jgi:hypothetical protein
MIHLFWFVGGWLFRFYLLINAFEQPSRQSYLLLVLFMNLYFYGYLWTIYMTVFVLTFERGIDPDPRIMSNLLSIPEVHNIHDQIVTVYQHPISQKYRLLLCKYGESVLIVMKYGSVAFLKFFLPTETLVYFPAVQPYADKLDLLYKMYDLLRKEN